MFCGDVKFHHFIKNINVEVDIKNARELKNIQS